MRWQTFEKRGFLRSIRFQATKTRQSLEDALLTVLDGRALSVIQGRINIGFSDGSGTSSSYVAPPGKSQSDVMALASELMDLRDEVEASLPDATTDDDIFQGMMDKLRAIKGYTFNPMYMGK